MALNTVRISVGEVLLLLSENVLVAVGSVGGIKVKDLLQATMLHMVYILPGPEHQ